MVGLKWTTPDQEKWLSNRLEGFHLARGSGKRYMRSWFAHTNEQWFEAFPPAVGEDSDGQGAEDEREHNLREKVAQVSASEMLRYCSLIRNLEGTHLVLQSSQKA